MKVKVSKFSNVDEQRAKIVELLDSLPAQENAEKLIKEYIVLQEKLTKLITSIQKANSINYIIFLKKRRDPDYFSESLSFS